jgi:hypothetical protein
MERYKKNQDLRQSDSLKSFSLLRPRSFWFRTASPDPEVDWENSELTLKPKSLAKRSMDDSQHVIVATQAEDQQQQPMSTTSIANYSHFPAGRNGNGNSK